MRFSSPLFRLLSVSSFTRLYLVLLIGLSLESLCVIRCFVGVAACAPVRRPNGAGAAMLRALRLLAPSALVRLHRRLIWRRLRRLGLSEALAAPHRSPCPVRPSCWVCWRSSPLPYPTRCNLCIRLIRLFEFCASTSPSRVITSTVRFRPPHVPY